MKSTKPLDEQRKANSERNAAQKSPQDNDQGIRKDQRGQDQPADKERAQRK